MPRMPKTPTNTVVYINYGSNARQDLQIRAIDNKLSTAVEQLHSEIDDAAMLADSNLVAAINQVEGDLDMVAATSRALLNTTAAKLQSEIKAVDSKLAAAESELVGMISDSTKIGDEYTTTIDVGHLDAGSVIHTDDTVQDILKNILYNDTPDADDCFDFYFYDGSENPEVL